MTVVISLFVLIALILIGFEIIYAFGGAVIFLVFALKYDPSFLFPSGYSNLSGIVLMAIPLFIIAGGIMEKGKIGGALVGFIRMLVGRIKGSLAFVAVIASAVFGSICGSGTATLSCIGSIMSPIMKDSKYPTGTTAAIICCAAPLGLLIPPSSIQILYAWSGQVSVLACFLATVLPGILLTILLCVGSWILLRKNPDIEVDEKLPKGMWSKEFGKSTKYASMSLMMPVIILGGIYGGFFTPTEAAAVSVIYAIPVAVFFYKGFRLRDLKNIFIESATTIGVVMAMMIMVVIFSQILVREDLPGYLIQLLFRVSDSPVIILLMINVFMIIIGMVMDDVSGVLLCTPILLPVAQQIGVDPVHFAAILGVNLGMGNTTPPNAPFIYLASRVCKAPAIKMMKPCLFLLIFAYIPTLLITTYWSDFSLFLPRLILGGKF